MFSFVLAAVEIVGPRWRVIVSTIWLTFWAVGYVILAGVAYLIKDWQVLQAVLTIPDVILLVLYAA